MNAPTTNDDSPTYHHRTLQAEEASADSGIPKGTPVDEAALNDPNSAISQLEKPDIR